MNATDSGNAALNIFIFFLLCNGFQDGHMLSHVEFFPFVYFLHQCGVEFALNSMGSLSLHKENNM